jgi:magnesium-protoporphyrin IX monomethyl ester (oxidative) cyclase
LIFLKNCVTYGVSPVWNLLVGFPGEGEEVYKKYYRDLPLLAHLPPPIGSYPVRFDRYSPYFTQAKQYGLDLHPVDYYGLTYPFGDQTLANLAYYFADHNVDADYFTTVARWIEKIRERVSAWQARWDPSKPGLWPVLYCKKSGANVVVVDSRSGELVEHNLSALGQEVLKRLSKPRKMSDLSSEVKTSPHLNLEDEIGLLQKKGLVFEEGGRFLSLVFPKEPPPPQKRVLIPTSI